MSFSPQIAALIKALRCLPGVGPKSAQRMAFYLLQRGRPQAKHLAEMLEQTCEQVGHCRQCHMLSEHDLCTICNDPKRDSSILCIVESPMDALAVEQTASFRGTYFVLMGTLSPIDGIGPIELGLPALEALLARGDIKEVILAISPTAEGEATSHYIAERVKQLNIKITRIARGIPMGSELEFLDPRTLTTAMAGRDCIHSPPL